MTTSGALGGWAQPGGPYSAAPLPLNPADAYGAGDCFAAGLAFALAAGLEGLDALDFAARCGAGALGRAGVHAEVVPSAVGMWRRVGRGCVVGESGVMWGPVGDTSP